MRSKSLSVLLIVLAGLVGAGLSWMVTSAGGPAPATTHATSSSPTSPGISSLVGKWKYECADNNWNELMIVEANGTARWLHRHGTQQASLRLLEENGRIYAKIESRSPSWTNLGNSGDRVQITVEDADTIVLEDSAITQRLHREGGKPQTQC